MLLAEMETPWFPSLQLATNNPRVEERGKALVIRPPLARPPLARPKIYIAN